MFMAAGLWSVVLVNLGFVGIALESISGNISRLWLAVPAIWFAGYPIYVAIDNNMQAALVAELANQNAAVQIALDPITEDLFWSDSGADTLVQDFGLQAIYKKGGFPYSMGGSRGATLDTVHFLASASVCNQFRTKGNANVYPINFWERSTERWPSKLVNEVCIIQIYENSKNPKITISREPDIDQRLEIDRSRDRLRIDLPTGKTLFLNVGTIKKLPWFPMPILGCGLISGGPLEGWRCTAQFWGTEHIPLLPYQFVNSYEAEILSKALGLSEKTGKARTPLPDDIVLKRISDDVSVWLN